MVGVVIGERSERQHLPGVHVEDDAAGGLGVIGGHRAPKLLAQHMLHAEVERQRQMTPLLRDEKVDFTLRELERVWDERTSGPY